MPSQDGNSDQHGRAQDKGSARRGDGQRWGRGSASALERMKELERRHGTPDERSGSADEREPGGSAA
jgi:hypothetical protein